MRKFKVYGQGKIFDLDNMKYVTDEVIEDLVYANLEFTIEAAQDQHEFRNSKLLLNRGDDAKPFILKRILKKYSNKRIEEMNKDSLIEEIKSKPVRNTLAIKYKLVELGDLYNKLVEESDFNTSDEEYHFIGYIMSSIDALKWVLGMNDKLDEEPLRSNLE